MLSATSKKYTLTIKISVLNSRSLSPKYLVNVLSNIDTRLLIDGFPSLSSILSDLTVLTISILLCSTSFNLLFVSLIYVFKNLQVSTFPASLISSTVLYFDLSFPFKCLALSNFFSISFSSSV